MAKNEALENLNRETRQKIEALRKETWDRAAEITALSRKYAEEVAGYKVGSIVRFKKCENGRESEIVFRVEAMSVFFNCFDMTCIDITGRRLCKDGKNVSFANKDKFLFSYCVEKDGKSSRYEYLETISEPNF